VTCGSRAATRASLRRGEGWKVPTEICVSAAGRVESVEFLRPAPAHDPRADAAILEAVRRWRYGSYRVDGTLRPFCHPHDIDLALR
jgi:TonB family protein